MQEKRPRKSKIEFSKVICIGVIIIDIAVTVFSLYMVYKTCDLSPLAYLIPSTAGAAATALGFYYSKAKAENKIKLMQQYGIEPDKSTFENINNTY